MTCNESKEEEGGLGIVTIRSEASTWDVLAGMLVPSDSRCRCDHCNDNRTRRCIDKNTRVIVRLSERAPPEGFPSGIETVAHSMHAAPARESSLFTTYWSESTLSS